MERLPHEENVARVMGLPLIAGPDAPYFYHPDLVTLVDMHEPWRKLDVFHHVSFSSGQCRMWPGEELKDEGGRSEVTFKGYAYDQIIHGWRLHYSPRFSQGDHIMQSWLGVRDNEPKDRLEAFLNVVNELDCLMEMRDLCPDSRDNDYDSRFIVLAFGTYNEMRVAMAQDHVRRYATSFPITKLRIG